MTHSPSAHSTLGPHQSLGFSQKTSLKSSLLHVTSHVSSGTLCSSPVWLCIPLPPDCVGASAPVTRRTTVPPVRILPAHRAALASGSLVLTCVCPACGVAKHSNLAGFTVSNKNTTQPHPCRSEVEAREMVQHMLGGGQFSQLAEHPAAPVPLRDGSTRDGAAHARRRAVQPAGRAVPHSWR